MKRSFKLCISGIIITIAVLIGFGYDILKTNEKEVNEKIIIGFSQVGAESDWRVANTESMKSALSEENGFQFIYSDAQQNQEKQITAVRNFIAQDVNIIVIAPVTETGWDIVLKEAKTAEIPVIIVDRMIDVSDDSLFTCWVGSDFEKEGQDAAKWLIDYMDTKKLGKEIVNIVVLKGTSGSSAELGRTKGFHNIIKEYPNFHILEERSGEFTQAMGQEVMESYIKKYETIDVVIAHNDNMAFGAIDVLKAAGRNPGKDVTVISFDAVRASFDYMIEGTLNVSVECNPIQGPYVAKLAKKIMAKEPVQKIQYVDEKVYSAETAKEDVKNRKY